MALRGSRRHPQPELLSLLLLMRGCRLSLLVCCSQLCHKRLYRLPGVLLAAFVRVRWIHLDRLNDAFGIVTSAERNFHVCSGHSAAGVEEFQTYIRKNQESIPKYGERYRQRETISTAFVESTINQVVSRRFVKKQQMHWTLRATHLLLQTRTKVLNGELEEVFQQWYPLFRVQAQAA